jgi:hypothetical protein
MSTPKQPKTFRETAERAGYITATTETMGKRLEKYRELQADISFDIWHGTKKEGETEKIISLGPFAVFKNIEKKYYRIKGKILSEVYPYLTALNYEAGGQFINALETRAALFEETRLEAHRKILRRRFDQIEKLREIEKNQQTKSRNSELLYSSCWRNVSYINDVFIRHVAKWFLVAAGLAWKDKYVIGEEVLFLQTLAPQNLQKDMGKIFVDE